MVLSTDRTGYVTTHAALQVLIVDDQASVREGLVRLLETQAEPGSVIRSAATLAEARQCIEGWHPDIVLLDVDLAGDDGLSLLPDLTPHARVLVLSSHADQATRGRAVRMGAAALMDKNEPAAGVLAAVHRMAAPHLRGDETPVPFGT